MNGVVAGSGTMACVKRDGLSLALQLHRAARLEPTGLRAQPRAGRLGDEELVTRGARILLYGRGGVDRVAVDGNLGSPAAADRAGQHGARVDPDADAQALMVQLGD